MDANTEILSADIVKSFRINSLARGYSLVPVKTNDKIPAVPAWNKGVSNRILEAVRSDALNTGINCDGLRVVDVDLDNFADVQAVMDLCRQHLGEAGMMRTRDNSCRVALFYRAESDNPAKVRIKTRKGAVEVLGRGQQCLVHGIHPSGAELRWLGGKSPANLSITHKFCHRVGGQLRSR